MADLKFDTDVFKDSIRSYNEIASDLKETTNKLKEQITGLETVWESDAGKAFQDMYKDGWVNNVNKYIIVLEELALLLNHASEKYETLITEADTIKLDSL